MPYRGGRRSRANKHRLSNEEIDKEMEEYFTNMEASEVQNVQHVQPAPPVQKRPLPALTAGAPFLTSPKKSRLDGTISLFGNAPFSANSAPPGTSVSAGNIVASNLAPTVSNVVDPSKIISTLTSAPPQPPLPTDQPPDTPTENISGNTEIVSTDTETVQREKTEEDVRAYCEVIDMFDQIVKKLWVRGRARKNATPKTESQWLLASVEKDLMRKMAARLNQLANEL